MASTINADTTNGVVITSDTTGEIKLQSAGADIATVSSTGITMASGKTLPASALTGTSPAGTNVISAGTEIASTSGTSIDFTSIPSWVKRITVMFNGMSTSGTANPLIQIGSGSITSSGYTSRSAYISGSSVSDTTFTAGFGIFGATASNTYTGHITVTNISSNIWVCSSVIGGTALWFSAGVVSLSGVLDQVRITTSNGTDTFDAGSINILYE